MQFNVKTFWGSTINAFAHSVVCPVVAVARLKLSDGPWWQILFFSIRFLFIPNVISGDALTMDNWVFGVTLYTAVVLTVLYKAALITK